MIERLLALAVLAASGVYLATGLSLPRGTGARPGPGFFPVAVGVFGAVVALAWVVSALRRGTTTGDDVTALADGRGRVGVTAVLLVVFCLLLPWLGYPVMALLFTGFLLRGLGARWTSAVVIGLGSAVGSYYFFSVMLGVPLPRGALLD